MSNVMILNHSLEILKICCLIWNGIDRIICFDTGFEDPYHAKIRLIKGQALTRMSHYVLW